MSAKPTPAQIRRMMAGRAKGIYVNKETLAEAVLCMRSLRSDEVAYTLVKSAGVFSAYTLRHMMAEVARWRDMGAKCLPCNMNEREIGGRKAWSIVIQPKDMEKEDPGYCPLSMALGTLVSGFTYICREKSLAELIIRALNA